MIYLRQEIYGYPWAAIAMDSRRIPPCDGFHDTMSFMQSLGRLTLHPVRPTFTRNIDVHVTGQFNVQGAMDLKIRQDDDTLGFAFDRERILVFCQLRSGGEEDQCHLLANQVRRCLLQRDSA